MASGLRSWWIIESGFTFSRVYSGRPANRWSPSAADVAPWRSQQSTGSGCSLRGAPAWAAAVPVSRRSTLNGLGARSCSDSSGALSTVGWFSRDAPSWLYDSGGGAGLRAIGSRSWGGGSIRARTLGGGVLSALAEAHAALGSAWAANASCTAASRSWRTEPACSMNA